MNTQPAPGTCAWRYVLTMDDLASFRLSTRSDVIGRWEIASTTFYHFYCKVKVGISAQCFTQPTSKSGKSYNGEQSDKVDSVPVMHSRVLILSPEATCRKRPSVPNFWCPQFLRFFAPRPLSI